MSALIGAVTYGPVSIDTNANTVSLLSGHAMSLDTVQGAFWVGFGLAVSFFVFGWCLRLVRFVGHTGD